MGIRDSDPARRSPTGAARPEALAALRAAGAASLQVGVDEGNPSLLGGPAPAAPALRGRRLVDRIAPAWVRLQVRWDRIQPEEASPPGFEQPVDGCSRGVQPCLPYAGTRAQLRAVAAAQRAAPGRYRLLVVVYGMPAWAGQAEPPGCGRGDTDASARPLAPGREAAYAAFLRALAAEAETQGVRVDALAPWNEPNVAYFLDPQRPRCDGPVAGTGVASVAPYARLLRTADGVLGEVPTSAVQPRRPALVVGELAAADRGRRHLVGADEFLAALPAADLCRADTVSLHRYVDLVDGAGAGATGAGAGADPAGRAAAVVEGAATAAQGPLDRAQHVLAGVPCAARTPVWITETGAGAPSGGAERDRRPAVLRGECRAMGRVLDAWRAAGRVRLALQYSVREDPAFPVGLLDAGLTAAVPAAELWAGWGGAREPPAAGPGVPAACAEQPGDAAVIAGLRPPADARDATPDS